MKNSSTTPEGQSANLERRKSKDGDTDSVKKAQQSASDEIRNVDEDKASELFAFDKTRRNLKVCWKTRLVVFLPKKP